MSQSLHKNVACELVKCPLGARACVVLGQFWRTVASARRPYLFLLPILAVASLNAQGVRVIEETAIPYTEFLSKADFDKRFPGETITDLSKLNTGWYVIYEHESLSYYFGPILLESIGEDYLAQLEETVGEAVAQRPSIEGYRLELSYEPSVSSSSSNSSSSPSSSEPPSEPSTSNPIPSQTPPKPSFWSFVKKIFGFG